MLVQTLTAFCSSSCSLQTLPTTINLVSLSSVQINHKTNNSTAVHTNQFQTNHFKKELTKIHTVRTRMEIPVRSQWK